jgi:hypothetical protein
MIAKTPPNCIELVLTGTLVKCLYGGSGAFIRGHLVGFHEYVLSWLL